MWNSTSKFRQINENHGYQFNVKKNTLITIRDANQGLEILRTLVDLPKDPGSILWHPHGCLQPSVNSNWSAFVPCFWLLWALGMPMVQRHTHRVNNCTYKI